MPHPPTVRVDKGDSIITITIDSPPVNALGKSVREELLEAFRAANRDSEVAGIIVTGVRGTFIGGADINEMDLAPSLPTLPELIEEIESSGKVVISAINGPALGGGLEIAMATDLRIATPSAKIGLPEVRLGIVPGAGGTQRLPRLTGRAKAIKMICESQIIIAEQALALGIIDKTCPDESLLEQARILISSVNKRLVSSLVVVEEAEERIDDALAAAEKKSRGIPAVRAAAALVRQASYVPFKTALIAERRTFLQLRDSPEAQALRYLFKAERASWKLPYSTSCARPISEVAIIGAGTMGAGIALAIAGSGIPVTVLERDEHSAAHGQVRIAELLSKRSRKPSAGQNDIVVTADWETVSRADLIIEAAFEDMNVKRSIFERLDGLAGPTAILATNTSYLDVAEIARFTKRPSNVIGLHFFSPAHIMRLLEIIRTDYTSPEVIVSAFAFAKTIGKQAVLANNSEGFIGNHIYAAYRRHAEYLLEDGASPSQIDTALQSFGFAMGVFATSDLSGLDIAYAFRRKRDGARHPAERYVAIADKIVEAGRLGRKTGAGWYRYEGDQRFEDDVIAELISAARRDRSASPTPFTDEMIQKRLLAVMVNEGARLLEKKVAMRPSDIDVVLTNGYGFPRGKGGPMWQADRVGLNKILDEVAEAHRIGGANSEPSELLVKLANSNTSFSDRS